MDTVYTSAILCFLPVSLTKVDFFNMDTSCTREHSMHANLATLMYIPAMLPKEGQYNAAMVYTLLRLHITVINTVDAKVHMAYRIQE